MKKLLVAALSVLMVITLAGCGEKMHKFTYSDIEISLPETLAFEDYDSGWTHSLYSDSTDIGVYMEFYSNEWLEENGYGNITLEELVDVYAEDFEEVTKTKKSNTLYVVTDVEDHEDFKVFNYSNVIKCDNGYWIVLFDCYLEDQIRYQKNFEKWTKSIVIK